MLQWRVDVAAVAYRDGAFALELISDALEW